MKRKLSFIGIVTCLTVLSISFGTDSTLIANGMSDNEFHDDGELCPDDGLGCIVVIPT